MDLTCGGGHFIRECPQRFKETCYHYGQTSDMAKDYFKMQGPPSGVGCGIGTAVNNSVGDRGRLKNPAEEHQLQDLQLRVVYSLHGVMKPRSQLSSNMVYVWFPVVS